MRVHYLHFDVLDSTNTWAKNHVHEFDLEALTCITAQEQTAGIGRFKRSWISPRGNLYATLFFTLPPNAPYLPNVGQILAYSCATYLRAQGFPAMIKWPNDLLIHKKKIAGILTEIVSLKDQVGVVLDIGLNVTMNEEELATISQPATSLRVLSKKKSTPEEILYHLVESFLENLTLLQQNGFAVFQHSFEEYLTYKGEEITLKIKNQPLKGLCQGITDDGRLKFLLPTGEILLLWNGAE